MEPSSNPIEDPPLIEFWKPSQFLDYVPPEGHYLVGQAHIQKGGIFVLGGAPGVGKSRATIALAISGAKNQPWFGLPTHRAFRTMIVQIENGPCRVKNDLTGTGIVEFDELISITRKMRHGFAFDEPRFVAQLRNEIATFEADLVMFDPLNYIAKDDKQEDYREAFDHIHKVIPDGENGPAIGIVAHTRKPKAEVKARGRELIHELAGSHVLVSRARCVFIMESASSDPEETRIALTCCKNNDGPLGEPTGWRYENGLFLPDDSFDPTFSGQDKPTRAKVAEEDVESIFSECGGKLTKQTAVERLMAKTGCGKSKAYAALSLEGEFRAHLGQEGDCLVWKP